MQSNNDFFEADKIDELKESLENVFMINKTLQELCDLIYQVQGETNPGQSYVPRASLLIKKNLSSFVIEPLQTMRYVCDTTSFLTSQEATFAHKERMNFIQNLQNTAENGLISTTFLKLQNMYYANQMSYIDFLNFASHELYKLNKEYKLYKGKKDSLYGHP